MSGRTGELRPAPIRGSAAGAAIAALAIVIVAPLLAGCAYGYSGPSCGAPFAAAATEQCDASIRRR